MSNEPYKMTSIILFGLFIFMGWALTTHKCVHDPDPIELCVELETEIDKSNITSNYFW